MTPEFAPLAAGLLAVVAVAALGFALFSGGSGGAQRLKKSMDAVEAGGGSRKSKSFFGPQELSAVDKLKELQAEKDKAKRVTMRQRLIQAGVTMGVAQYLLLFQIAGVAAGVAAYVGTGELLAGAGAGAFVALFLPSYVTSSMIKRRVKKFLDLFPNAIDVLVRGVRSGLPVSEGLRVISTQIDDPVGPEMARVVASTQVGMGIDDALETLYQRVPNQDVNFFRTVLSIQKSTGGNLAESLENLSGILRERRKMKQKIYALSSEARMSAIIIGSLPIVVGFLVYLMRPDYILILFEEQTGQMLLGGGVIWMSFGIMIMRSMVRFEI